MSARRNTWSVNSISTTPVAGSHWTWTSRFRKPTPYRSTQITGKGSTVEQARSGIAPWQAPWGYGREEALLSSLLHPSLKNIYETEARLNLENETPLKYENEAIAFNCVIRHPLRLCAADLYFTGCRLRCVLPAITLGELGLIYFIKYRKTQILMLRHLLSDSV